MGGRRGRVLGTLSGEPEHMACGPDLCTDSRVFLCTVHRCTVANSGVAYASGPVRLSVPTRAAPGACPERPRILLWLAAW